MASALQTASAARASSRDQVVVLRGISWAQFEALARRENAGVRIAYLDGNLEIVSPSSTHEIWKKFAARLLETHAEERGLTMAGCGSTTYHKKAKQAGVEPDESYIFNEQKRFPDLVIEVIVSHSGLNRLEIYRRLRVGELWLLSKKGIRVLTLEGRRYVPQERSVLLPEIDLAEIWNIVRTTPLMRQTQAIRAYRQSLRRRRGKRER
jgi:Uma2 family endonuclease